MGTERMEEGSKGRKDIFSESRLRLKNLSGNWPHPPPPPAVMKANESSQSPHQTASQSKQQIYFSFSHALVVLSEFLLAPAASAAVS
ncbi:hypothetical protein ATANTOWER_028662 [Ataeniobius toweri]|uniref:Uncharacterized protein n=1 Tax=Ataeniobius toweri TaxID=208326 RepID=A0ABU7A349_9TELE|nr:hypothetical protein [Ataeniobius toweri]